MNSYLSSIIRKLIEMRGRYYLKYRFRNLEQFQKLQESVLLEKIRRNQDSEFGKRFGFFNIKSISDYQKRVPLTEYDIFRPYIERVKRGDLNALFGPEEKVHMYALTSGTTGSAKYIPVTTSFLKEYQEGSKMWTSSLAVEIASRPLGKVLPLVSRIQEETTSDGVACGAISGLIAKNQGKLVSRFLAAPYEACCYKTSKERLYAFLRAGAEHSVTVITTANPSTLIQFADLLEKEGESLIKDLEKGTLWGKKAPFKLRRMKRKAANLKKILSSRGRLLPTDLWPKLQILTCWKGGTLFHYIEKLPKIYGESITIKDIGLLASEGRFSIPLIKDSDDGILNVFHHFYEFVEENEEDLSNPQTLLADQLEIGKRYFLVVTTSSGLYRYKLHDLIEVTGFYQKVPIIHFLNKGKHIASMTGEKITENQVLKSVVKVADDYKVPISNFRFFPRAEEMPYYLLYMEKESDDMSVPSGFKESLDKEIQLRNVEYASKRSSGRLKGVQTAWVKKGTFSDLQKTSHRQEQFKPVYLNPDPNGYLEFEKCIIS